ncbi:MAG: hypothetical protein WEB60_02415 [Terrimicrobiaceae bacterium]
MILRTCARLGVLTGLLVGNPLIAATHDWSAEPLKDTKINTVAFRGWVPDTTEPLAGVLVLIPGRHGDGRGMADNARWQQLANDVGFAILGCQFADGDPGRYQSDDKGEVAKAINEAVNELSKLSARPELVDAPLAFWGTSAGSNVSSKYCGFFPERVVAMGSSKGTWGPGGNSSPKFLEIPMIYAIGANDNPEWVKVSTEHFDKGQGKAPWTLALQPNEGHGVEGSLDAILPFLTSAINQRLGKSTSTPSSGNSIFKSELPKIGSNSSSTTKSKTALKKLNLRDGWLGDPKTYDVAAYSDFKGSKSSAIWLPDESAALAWQSYLRK